MLQYLDFLRHIREHGASKGDRTGTGTLSVFGYQMRFDLNAGFPLVTTKKVHLRSVVYELLWFLRGDTNVAWLREHGALVFHDIPDVPFDAYRASLYTPDELYRGLRDRRPVLRLGAAAAGAAPTAWPRARGFVRQRRLR